MGLLLFSRIFVEISELNANSVDPDQTPRSDLGQHCLPMSLLLNARLIWVKLLSGDLKRLFFLIMAFSRYPYTVELQ